MGYNPDHKGYKCPHLPSGQVYILRDVAFNELLFSFEPKSTNPISYHPSPPSNLSISFHFPNTRPSLMAHLLKHLVQVAHPNPSQLLIQTLNHRLLPLPTLPLPLPQSLLRYPITPELPLLPLTMFNSFLPILWLLDLKPIPCALMCGSMAQSCGLQKILLCLSPLSLPSLSAYPPSSVQEEPSLIIELKKYLEWHSAMFEEFRALLLN